MTGNDLIYSGFRIAGILGAADRTLSGSDTNEGLRAINSMIDAWRAERLMVYAYQQNIFDIVANKGSYTIGEGGDLDVPRPERVEQATLLQNYASPPTEVPLRVLSQQEWASVSLKGLTSTLPWGLYYEPEIPLGKVFLYPIPTDATNQFSLWLWQSLQTLSLAGNITLPPAYQEAIEYNLALRLAARYPDRQKLSPLAIDQARQSLTAIKTRNAPALLMETEAAARETGRRNQGSYNIYTNSFTGNSGGF